MNLSPYELALISGGFAIIGALIGAWIALRSAISVYKLSEFNKAAALFREAFYIDLIFIKHNIIVAEKGSSDNLSTFLSAGYLHRHLKALETFKYYLTVKECAEIDKAWRAYCYNPDKPGTLFFEQYSCKLMNKDTKTEELKLLALTRIEELLKFAKHK